MGAVASEPVVGERGVGVRSPDALVAVKRLDRLRADRETARAVPLADHEDDRTIQIHVRTLNLGRGQLEVHELRKPSTPCRRAG